jgi:hypothetical protein
VSGETWDTIRDKPAYGRLRRVIDTAQRLSERTAMSPDRVADVVLEAAESPDPKARYVVGWDARLAILADRLLPGRATEWLYERLGCVLQAPSEQFAVVVRAVEFPR